MEILRVELRDAVMLKGAGTVKSLCPKDVKQKGLKLEMGDGFVEGELNGEEFLVPFSACKIIKIASAKPAKVK